MDKLINLIERHDASAVAFGNSLLVTSCATQSIDGRVISFDVTQKIAASRSAVLAWLGY